MPPTIGWGIIIKTAPNLVMRPTITIRTAAHWITRRLPICTSSQQIQYVHLDTSKRLYKFYIHLCNLYNADVTWTWKNFAQILWSGNFHTGTWKKSYKKYETCFSCIHAHKTVLVHGKEHLVRVKCVKHSSFNGYILFGKWIYFCDIVYSNWMLIYKVNKNDAIRSTVQEVACRLYVWKAITMLTKASH